VNASTKYEQFNQISPKVLELVQRKHNASVN
jgi:hypothetical protein